MGFNLSTTTGGGGSGGSTTPGSKTAPFVYTTKALLESTRPASANNGSFGYVTADPDPENNGDYICDGTSWNMIAVDDATRTQSGASGYLADRDHEGGGADPITLRRPNVASSAPPTVTDDSDSMYRIGTRWYDYTNHQTYVLSDATVGAAKWNLVDHIEYQNVNTTVTLDETSYGKTVRVDTTTADVEITLPSGVDGGYIKFIHVAGGNDVIFTDEISEDGNVVINKIGSGITIFYNEQVSLWEKIQDSRGTSDKVYIYRVKASGNITRGSFCRIRGEASDVVTSGGTAYRCKVSHTSSAATEPGVGANWTDVWILESSQTGGHSAWVDATAYTYDQSTLIQQISSSDPTSQTPGCFSLKAMNTGEIYYLAVITFGTATGLNTSGFAEGSYIMPTTSGSYTNFKGTTALDYNGGVIKKVGTTDGELIVSINPISVPKLATDNFLKGNANGWAGAVGYKDLLKNGQNVIFVGKHGTTHALGARGKNWNDAYNSFTEALDNVKSGIVSGDVVVCLDDGNYQEDFTVPDGVDIHAPHAAVDGQIVTDGNFLITLQYLSNTVAAGSDNPNLIITGSYSAFPVFGTVNIHEFSQRVSGGKAIRINAGTTGTEGETSIHINCDEIHAFNCDNSDNLMVAGNNVNVDYNVNRSVLYTNAEAHSGGRHIWMHSSSTGSKVNIRGTQFFTKNVNGGSYTNSGGIDMDSVSTVRGFINGLNADTAYDVGVGATLKVYVGELSGTETALGTAEVVVPGDVGMGGGGASIVDDAYDAGWNGDTLQGASRNALYQKFESLVAGGADGAAIQSNTVNSLIANGISIDKMDENVYMPFVDETDIDTGNSVNQIYDSVNNLYRPIRSAIDHKAIIVPNGVAGTSTFEDVSAIPCNVSVNVGTPVFSDAVPDEFGGNRSTILFGGPDVIGVTPDPNENESMIVGTNDMHFSAWLRFNSVAGTQFIASVWSYTIQTTDGQGWQLYSDGGRIYLRQNASGDDYGIVNSRFSTVNTWFHLALSKVSGIVNIYVNGTRIDTRAVENNNWPSSRNVLDLGGWNTNTDKNFNGYMGGVTYDNESAGIYTGATYVIPTIDPVAVANPLVVEDFNYADMTLVTNSIPVTIEPIRSKTIIQIGDIGSSVLNTDVILQSSRDDGANWISHTLTQAYAEIYVTDVVDLSSQTDAKSLRWRLLTTNNSSAHLKNVWYQYDRYGVASSLSNYTRIVTLESGLQLNALKDIMRANEAYDTYANIIVNAFTETPAVDANIDEVATTATHDGVNLDYTFAGNQGIDPNVGLGGSGLWGRIGEVLNRGEIGITYVQSGARTLSSFSFNVVANTATTGTLRLEVAEDNGSGLPGTVIAQSDIFNMAGITGGWKNFILQSPVALSDATRYYFYLTVIDPTGSAGEYLEVGHAQINTIYDRISSYQGSWQAITSTYTVGFRAYTSPTDMILQSNPLTLDIEPNFSKGIIIIDQALATDDNIVLLLSRDGVTYIESVLTLIDTMVDGSAIYESSEVDLSAQTGNTLYYRVDASTFSTYSVKAISVTWRAV